MFYANDCIISCVSTHGNKWFQDWKRVELCISFESMYSIVLKYRDSITYNDQIQNQITCKLSQIQKIVNQKSFLEFHLAYKNVRLKFLPPILLTTAKSVNIFQ